MIPRFRTALILSCAALALAACKRPSEQAAAPGEGDADAVVATSGAAAPFAFSDRTTHAVVSLTLPEALKDQGNLHATLYADEVRKLRQFMEGAQGARTEVEGEDELPPYEKTVVFALGAETGKLFSLRREDFDWSGGVHPNTLLGSLLWDKALQRLIGPGDLFRKGVSLAPLDQALCSAINAARRARVPDAMSLQLGAAEGGCPHAIDLPFVLAAGSAPGKAGGLVFLISPYQVGAYVEGAYEIAVPQAVFRSLIDPAYADEFAGQPLKVGDVTRQS